MYRIEHNAYWQWDRKSTDTVCTLSSNYGEAAQYDGRCAACYLHHPHSWAQHDTAITAYEAQATLYRDRLDCVGKFQAYQRASLYQANMNICLSAYRWHSRQINALETLLRQRFHEHEHSVRKLFQAYPNTKIQAY